MHDLFIEQTQAWIKRLDAALWECYEWHPHLGDIPKGGNGRRIRKIKRIKDKARRRLNYHLNATGYPIPISRAFAMWVINDVYKPGKRG